ncbi:hypothetical protein T492DRAFT_832612 [Pavlovales sp. CCMP2436]|nr:hypothetical protein T492DRAFT_832612 [Pavlovales sp. CCMP2436]
MPAIQRAATTAEPATAAEPSAVEMHFAAASTVDARPRSGNDEVATADRQLLRLGVASTPGGTQQARDEDERSLIKAATANEAAAAADAKCTGLEAELAEARAAHAAQAVRQERERTQAELARAREAATAAEKAAAAAEAVETAAAESAQAAKQIRDHAQAQLARAREAVAAAVSAEEATIAQVAQDRAAAVVVAVVAPSAGAAAAGVTADAPRSARKRPREDVLLPAQALLEALCRLEVLCRRKDKVVKNEAGHA